MSTEQAGADFDISYTIPSACARALRAGTADIGIIPAAAYTTIPDLVIIPDVAIAARRAVRSILLVSKMPIDQGADCCARYFFHDVGGARPKFCSPSGWADPANIKRSAPDLDAMLAARDAALLIGDPALQVDRSRYTTLDLAEEWIARTGKSFVFAFWAVRRPALAGHDATTVAAAFQRSRDHGVSSKNLEAIAQQWAPRLGLALEVVRTYLVHNIHYFLDPPGLDGLKEFYRLGAEIGALPHAPELHFL